MPTAAAPGTFVFREALHEARRANRHADVATISAARSRRSRSCTDLATAPATAQHIGAKLARHVHRRYSARGCERQAGERVHDERRRSADAVPHIDRHARSLVARRGEVQDAVGMGDFVDARARLARPRQSAGRASVDAAWSTGMASGFARRLRRRRRKLGRARCARAPRRGRAALRGARRRSSRRSLARAGAARRIAGRAERGGDRARESASTAIALLLVSPDFQRR